MSDADAFDLMGLEPSFRIDSERLERTHRELSSALHPDRYLGRSSTERQAALGKAIEVNAAYKLLRNPLERGQLLLQRLGVPTSATQLPPEFLMEIMELREELQ